jgi:hypothetical protein
MGLDLLSTGASLKTSKKDDEKQNIKSNIKLLI